MIKRIIFDIDETLITGVDFYPYLINAFKKYGINDLEKARIYILNNKEYEKKYSYYKKDVYLHFFSNILQINLNENFLEIYWNELKKAIPEKYDNIKYMLSTMTDYELVLLSNFFEESQRNRLISMGINDYFTEYYGEKIIKPNALAYKIASGMHHSHECVIVGDNKKLDIDIPKSLGFKTIYVNENGDIKKVEELTPTLIKSFK